ncbi:class I SAM-dependent methyltransferase [Streptomyces monticola]|uniref:Class I SAM-dependent methyltransferase n=1 Tax=Streptomyces monticola TaxID=2666263 RepID=A0ABW2JFQ5_9ACTN
MRSANYRAFHRRPPAIVQVRTTALGDLLEPSSHRFVHIDASHMYDDVRGDIDITRRILRPGGVVALDDYRTERVPGVAAAVREAVFTKGLHPVCVSANNLYATWGAGDPLREAVRQWADGQEGMKAVNERIAGEVMVRVAGGHTERRCLARQLARELLPRRSPMRTAA